MIDLFENAEYYFIVLELMEGKDLLEYLKHKEFKITEKRAKQITI